MPIPNFPDYFASDDGCIWSFKPARRGSRPPDKPRLLKPFIAAGYRMVILMKDANRVHKKVATCVLEAFIGERPAGMEACDGPLGQLVDSLGNLSWKTKKENNTVDKERDGSIMRGMKNGNAKLTENAVREIRRLRGIVSQRKLARRYDVALATIDAIQSRKIWKEVH